MGTNVGRRNFVNLPGSHLAQGFWGHFSGAGVHARFVGDQTVFKALKANVDKMLGMGLQADLWREVSPAPYTESAPIRGIAVTSFAAGMSAGPGALTFAIVGPARNVTWTAPGGIVSPTLNVRGGGIYTLVSSGHSISISVSPDFLPTTGGPFTNVLTFTKNPMRIPTFDPQMDQTSVTNRVFPLCTCFKNTSKQPDNKCLSCFGTGIIPGYTKFGHTEYTFAATDPANTLTNTALFIEHTPYRLQIAPGFTTCTILSPVFAVTPAVVAAANPFQFDARTYLRQPAGTSVLIDFSVNAGAWVNINLLSLTSVTAGSALQFRVTMTRTLVTDKSPFFEILRVRFPRLTEPYIRALRAFPTRPRSREAMGVVESDGSVRFWTVPLMFFDDQLPQDPDTVTPTIANLIQPKAFLEFREGAYVGKRYDLTGFSYSDPKGILISQQFSCRLLQPDEIQNQVF